MTTTFLEGRYADRTGYQEISPERVCDIVFPGAIGALNRPEGIKSIKVPPQYFVRLENVLCLPRQVLIHDGELLPDTFRRRNSKMPHVQLERTELGFRPYKPIESFDVVTEPCFYLDGEHIDHFGHFTLEVLSRLWAFEHLDFSKFVFITSARPNPRHQTLLTPLGIDRAQIRYFTRPVLCRSLVIASQGYLLEGSVSDEALAVWRRIAAYYRGGPIIERLYVSRSNWLKQRNLLNEREVESIASSHGFKIISPETLGIEEQVNLFSRSISIAGPSGSSLYNCVYSSLRGNRTILASSKFVTLNDSLVNRASNSSLVYLTGSVVQHDKPGMLADWQIDTDIVEGHLRAALKGI